MARIKYEWKRFWSPRDGIIHLGDHGFLTDPNDWGGYHNTTLRTSDQLLEFPCLVLLGEPGIGKSTSIEEMVSVSGANRTDIVHFVDFREYGDESRFVYEVLRGKEITAWQNSDSILHLFLDSLDEGLLQIKQLKGILTKELKHWPIDRLKLRIACRTARWEKYLEDELNELWPANDSDPHREKVWELVPLRRSDVMKAIEAEGLDPQATLETFVSTGIVPLAIKPVTLSFLISGIKHHGSLPATRIEAYQRGTTWLCEEQNPLGSSVQPVLNANGRQMVAARVAFASILGNRFAIWTGPNDGSIPAEDVSIADLVGNTESADSVLIPVSHREVEETLNTGLFSARGSQRMGWAHQSYAEFLTAFYLLHRDVPVKQLLSLFVHPDDEEERFIPQLHETIGWLASMSAAFFSEVASREPEALLTADDEALSDVQRSIAAASFIQRVIQGKAQDIDWRLGERYKALRHPNLAKQLRSHIREKSIDSFGRTALIRIARQCQVIEIQDVLADIAIDPSEPTELRRWSIAALEDIADDNTKARMRDIVLPVGRFKPNEGLTWQALSVLWPQHISVEEILSVFKYPDNAIIGDEFYHFFVHDFRKGLKREDLPSILKWMRANLDVPDGLHFTNDTISEIRRFAWSHSDTPENFSDFVLLAQECAKRHENVLHSDDGDSDDENPYFACPQRTRELVTALVTACENPAKAFDYAVYKYPSVLRDSDIPWLVEQYTKTTGPNLKLAWANMIENLVHRNKLPCDELLAACKRFSELSRTLKFVLGPIEIDSEEAKHLMRSHKQYKTIATRRVKPEPITAENLERALQLLADGQAAGWCYVGQILKSNPNIGEKLITDDGKSTVWAILDESDRNRILVAACLFLEEYVPPNIHTPNCREFKWGEIYGVDALILLLRNAPMALAAFPAAFWQQWSSSLVNMFFPSDVENYEWGHKIVSEAYNHAQSEIKCALSHKIQGEQDELQLDLDRFRFCWDEQLFQLILTALNENELTETKFRKLLEPLIEYGCEPALDFALSVLSSSDDEKLDVHRISCAALLMLYRPHDTWHLIKAYIFNNSELGKKLVELYINLSKYTDHSRKEQHLATSLREIDIQNVFIWLQRIYPEQEDPPFASGPIGFRDEVRRWRHSFITYLKEGGTKAACNALRGIAIKCPELNWLPRTILDAELVYRQKTWRAMPVRALLELLVDSTRRKVQSERELLEVVFEALERYQVMLQGENPAIVFLWDRQGDINSKKFRPKYEKEFSSHMSTYLVEDLRNRAIIVNREVEIRPGEETDIHIDSFVTNLRGEISERIRVIVEVKCSWNQDLKDDLTRQLIERYLRENQCTHGIYAVCWFSSDKWDSGDGRKAQSKRAKRKEIDDSFETQILKASELGVEVRYCPIECVLR